MLCLLARLGPCTHTPWVGWGSSESQLQTGTAGWQILTLFFFSLDTMSASLLSNWRAMIGTDWLMENLQRLLQNAVFRHSVPGTKITGCDRAKSEYLVELQVSRFMCFHAPHNVEETILNRSTGCVLPWIIRQIFIQDLA